MEMRSQIAIYLFSSLLLCSNKSPAQIVLTEIMFDALGSDTHDEFVEIVNLSDEAVDVTAWQISDGTGFDTIVEATQGTILQPGQFGIILDASYFSNSTTYGNIIAEGSLILTIDNQTFGSGGFTNSRSETVTLIDASGNVVSEYTYSIGNEMGFSDEKIDLSGPNSADNWADTKLQFGTPGFRNSVSPKNFDLAIFSNDINFTPEKIIAVESVVISANVRNFGVSTATDFQVTFFEDLNNNLSPDSGEELANPLEFRDNLMSGDSVSLSIDYTALTAGEHLIFVKIAFEADEDTTNNLANKTLLIGSSEGAVVINEIMYSPLSDEAEWIELLNLSSTMMNLRNWQFSDSDAGKRAVVEEDIFLLPDDYFVLAEDSTILQTFTPPAGSFAVLKNWPSLNNSFDSVVLYDLLGTAIDRVDYENSWGGDAGISLEKINPKLASNDSSNWSSSVTFEGGTPGALNSIFTERLPSETTLSIDPNPFSPDGDGNDDFAIINYQLPTTTAVVNVKIYDMRGRLIRFLANNRPTGSQNSIIWDGQDNDGRLARMGIYIIFLQGLNAEAGILLSEKKTVVLASQL